MPYTPSWLNPPDFLGASEAGSRLGLSRAQMIEQANEHEAELALRRDELASRAASENAQRQGEQSRYNAAMALRQAALKQQGLLGAQRNQNQSEDVQARDALDKAREEALNRHQLKVGKDTHFQDISRQAAAAYKAANPNVSNAELMSRFPMAFKSNSEIPTVPKAPVSKPASPLLTQGIQDKIFDTELANGGGGTNVDYAISALNKYKNPAAVPDADQAATPSASDALQTPPDSDSGLPDLTGTPAPSTSPVTATNPKTGEKMILQDGKWQAIPPPQ